jgi:hypothetical protein
MLRYPDRHELTINKTGRVFAVRLHIFFEED